MLFGVVVRCVKRSNMLLHLTSRLVSVRVSTGTVRSTVAQYEAQRFNA